MVESIQSGINQWLNQPMVESTYGCRESQKSKKVKNPADCRTLVLYQAKAPIRQVPGPIRQVPHRGLIKAPGSWELGGELGELGAGTRAGELVRAEANARGELDS